MKRSSLKRSPPEATNRPKRLCRKKISVYDDHLSNDDDSATKNQSMTPYRLRHPLKKNPAKEGQKRKHPTEGDSATIRHGPKRQKKKKKKKEKKSVEFIDSGKTKLVPIV